MCACHLHIQSALLRWMPTKNSVFRLEDEVLALADAVGVHEARRAARGKIEPNRTQALRVGIAEAYEARQPAMAADRAAWESFKSRAASEISTYSLHGRGVGDPIPAERTQLGGPRGVTLAPLSLWGELEVTVFLDGRPVVNVPVIVEVEAASLSATVFLTDEAGLAKVYLGPLSRVVDEHDAYYDNRLFRLEQDLQLGSPLTKEAT